VLDRHSGDFFLRARETAFPGRQIAEFFGITSGRLYGHIDANIVNLTGDRHRRLRTLVAHAPRMPALALDGPPRLGGVEGIYGTESLPLRWT
jgi:hypothetical protein